MKKRLRKKLHKGEYRQFGFEMSFRFRPGLDKEAIEEFVDAFLVEAVKEHGLSFGGIGDDAWSGFIVPVRKSATEEERRVVENWLAGREELVKYQVGPLVDAWYGT